MFPYERANYPEGYKKEPWCPHTKLVQIGISLAGIEVNPNYFCYAEIQNPVYSDGAIHYFEGGDFFPKASCSIVNKALDSQLQVVAVQVEKPSEPEASTELHNAKSLAEKIEIIKTYEKAMNTYNERQKIMDRWRTVIFETCCSTTESEANVHFSQFKSADELSEEEIVGLVEKFKDALQKIVGHGKDTIGWHVGEVKNCNQAPRLHSYRKH